RSTATRANHFIPNDSAPAAQTLEPVLILRLVALRKSKNQNRIAGSGFVTGSHGRYRSVRRSAGNRGSPAARTFHSSRHHGVVGRGPVWWDCQPSAGDD